MTDSLFVFQIPEMFDRDVKAEIAGGLELLTFIAFYMAGGGRLGFKALVEEEWETEIDSYNPPKVYEECKGRLEEIIAAYNARIIENHLSFITLKMAVDEDKSRLLSKDSVYRIYNVTPNR
jgi:hypothetical protein